MYFLENVTEKTSDGILVVAVYDENNVCRQVKFALDGKAEFDKIISGTIKAFLWNGLSGKSSLQPLLKSVSKSVTD